MFISKVRSYKVPILTEYIVGKVRHCRVKEGAMDDYIPRTWKEERVIESSSSHTIVIKKDTIEDVERAMKGYRSEGAIIMGQERWRTDGRGRCDGELMVEEGAMEN